MLDRQEAVVEVAHPPVKIPHLSPVRDVFVACGLTFIRLVRTFWLLDEREGFV